MLDGRVDRSTRRRRSRTGTTSSAAARARGERGAAPPAIVVCLGLLAGAATGFVLERAGVVDPLGEPAPVIVRIDRVTAFDCPEGTPVRVLARGDRVVATAQTDDGDWIEIRSPVDLDARVWVSRTAIEGDGGDTGIDRLPEAPCDHTGPSTTTTSTSTTSTSTTTTSTTSTTSTTTTSTTVVATTSTSTTQPNAPPDVRLAVEGNVHGQPIVSTTSSTSSTLPTSSTTSTTLPSGTFFYVHTTPSSCRVTADATVDAVDPDGVATVHLRWDTGAGGTSGQQPMVRLATTNRWQLALQFPQQAVPAPDQSRQPSFAVIVTDGRGVTTTLDTAPVSAFRVFRGNQPCAQ
jgi:hypothetical protein